MEQSAQNLNHNWWKNFLYSGYQTQDDLILRQVFFINTFAVLGFFSVIVFGILHFLDRNYFVAVPEILGGGIFFLAIVYLRISKNIFISKIILLLTQGVLLIVMLATGGTENTGIFWYFTFPITAFFLMGKRYGIIWILGLYIATLFLFILGSYNLVSIAYSFIEIRQLLVSLFVISALIYLYQNTIKKTENMYRQQTDQLKIAKRAIEQAKVEDEAILASLGEGMVTMGTSGNIFLINNAALKMLRRNEQDMVGQLINDVVPLKDSKGNNITSEQRPWNQAKNSGEKVSGEYIFVRADNSEVPVALTTTPFILNGQIIGVIELFRDITEEKKLDQAKSEFVALASHQLRTPISAISWFTEMLLHGDAGKITEEQKEHLIQIYQSNKRMAALVDALLNVSRIEMGNFSIKPLPTDLSAFSHRVLMEELGKQEPVKKFVIKENYGQQAITVPVDQDLLKIILQNLFTNSIKYTPENGTISIAISPTGQMVDNGVNNKEEGIIITVSDTGYGIPKAQADKIFTKLFRADNIKAKDTDGTGLGLYIVKSIVEAVGWRIWFESPARNASQTRLPTTGTVGQGDAGGEETKGTKFYILLPKTGMKEQQGEKKLVPAKNNE